MYVTWAGTALGVSKEGEGAGVSVRPKEAKNLGKLTVCAEKEKKINSNP